MVNGISGNVRADEMDLVWNSGLVGVLVSFLTSFASVIVIHPFSIFSIGPTGTCEGGVSSLHG